jgi:adenylosuccinate lyase
MLGRLTGLLKNLLVYPEAMVKNLGLTRGLIFSQRLMLELVRKGITREEAYLLVQGPAMRVWQEGLDFPDLIRQDPEIAKHLTPKEIDAVFDLQEYLKHVDYLFQRVFGK